jgi:uncharacterized membrane protein YhaH (DUF805 family)
MGRLLSAIRSGFGGILSFGGRSGRADFWIYAVFIFILAFLAWAIVFGMEMARSFEQVQRYAAENPDKVTIAAGPGQYSVKIKDGAPGVGPDFAHLLKWLAFIGFASIALLAAAATRRLHDTNKSGWWAVIPLPFLFGGLWMMALVHADMNSAAQLNMGLFGLVFVNNLIYLIALGFAGFLLLRAGTKGENRFGVRNIEEVA